MNSEITNAFVRQRRSLIITSIVLAVVLWFGIDGSKLRLGPGAGTGLSVDFEDARVVIAGLVIVWLWFLVRYWQYFSLVRPKAREALHAAQLPQLRDSFTPIMRELGAAKALTEIGNENPSLPGTLEVRSSAVSREFERAKLKYAAANVLVSPTLDKHDGRTQGLSNRSVRVQVEGFAALWRILRAILPVNIKHPYFTEHWLPFGIALITFVLLIVRWRIWLPPVEPSGPWLSF